MGDREKERKAFNARMQSGIGRQPPELQEKIQKLMDYSVALRKGYVKALKDDRLESFCYVEKPKLYAEFYPEASVQSNQNSPDSQWEIAYLENKIAILEADLMLCSLGMVDEVMKMRGRL